jgi:hypothetical protein
VRIANVLVTGTLFTAVIAEGAYIIKTHRQMEALTTQVQQLASEVGDDPVDRTPAPERPWVGERPTGSRNPARNLPPPRFNTAAAPTTTGSAVNGTVALPPVLDTPEARDQLRQFVTAELQHQRDDWRQQQQQQREEAEQRRLESAIKTLGLNGDEAKKLTEAVSKAQDQRRDLREKIQSGQIARADIGKEMGALREQTDKDLRAAVGDDRAQKFQELQRQNRGPGGGPGGGGPGFGGGFRGGPPGGGPGGPPGP